MWSNTPRRSWHSSMTVPTYSFGTITLALTYGSSTCSMRPASGICEGLRTSTTSPADGRHLVGDVRRGGQQVEVELALQPLAHDVHVQQAEEAAAEAEAERLAGLRLVDQRGVVELQLGQRVAQVAVVLAVGREEAREDHRLDVLVARQRLGGRPVVVGEGVADADLRRRP